MSHPSLLLSRPLLVLLALIPLWLGYPLYLLGMLLWSQVGHVRTLGVLALGLWPLVMVAGLVAWGARRLPVPPVSLRRWARLAFYAGTLVNVAAIGLSIYFQSAPLAPSAWKLGVAALIAVLLLAFWFYSDASQRIITHMLTASGVAVLGVMLASGTLAWLGGLLHESRLPGRPEPLAGQPVATAPKRILLVTFDGLRARSWGLKSTWSRRPVLAALARESTVYTGARAAADATLASLPTILTGVRPHRVFPRLGNKTGFIKQGYVVGLPGHLAPAGYASRYVTMLTQPSVFGLQAEFPQGYTTGYHYPVTNDFNTAEFLPWRPTGQWVLDKFSRQRDEKGLLMGPAGAKVAVERAVSEMAQAPARSFTWVHLGVPHSPFMAVKRVGTELVADPSTAVTFEDATAAKAEQEPGYEAIYEDFVSIADAELGRLVDGLKREGLWDDTMVVVTSDHGEEFTPGLRPHANALISEDVAHVPLVIRMPGQTRPEVRHDFVGHVDLAPTILDAVYGRVPAGMDGLSLLRPLPERVVLSSGIAVSRSLMMGGFPSVAVYDGRYKYLLVLPDHDRLFDLASDPRGMRDIASAHPEHVARLKPEALRVLAHWGL